MFAITPHGETGSGSKTESASKKYWHFFKLSAYFVAIRAAHVYFGPTGESSDAATASN